MTDVKASGVINYTTTGTKTHDSFNVSPCDTVSIGVTINTGPAVYHIEVQLQTDGKWFRVVASASTSDLYILDARFAALRLVIASLDAGSIDFEVVRAQRGNH